MMDPRYGEDVISGSNPATQLRDTVNRKIQYWLDKSTPHPTYRWIGSLVIALIYALRVYFVQGFYIVTYGLGIFLLNLLIGFLSPQVDPELEGPSLPQKGSDEFKPFIRRLPEFKFWYALTKAVAVAFVLTFFPFFDVPVFWPILLVYWFTLFVLTMKRQIRHMIKYKYIPFSFGKQVPRFRSLDVQKQLLSGYNGPGLRVAKNRKGDSTASPSKSFYGVPLQLLSNMNLHGQELGEERRRGRAKMELPRFIQLMLSLTKQLSSRQNKYVRMGTCFTCNLGSAVKWWDYQGRKGKENGISGRFFVKEERLSPFIYACS